MATMGAEDDLTSLTAPQRTLTFDGEIDNTYDPSRVKVRLSAP